MATEETEVQRITRVFNEAPSTDPEDFAQREQRWANDFRRMENRMAKFLERAENAEDALRQMTECRDDLKRLIASGDDPDGILIWRSDHEKILKAALAQKTRECEELKESQKPKCPDCNAVGMRHCSDPENCGGLYWPDSLYRALEAQVEQLGRQVAETSREVTNEECLAFERSYGEKLLLNYVEVGLSDFVASRARTK